MWTMCELSNRDLLRVCEMVMVLHRMKVVDYDTYNSIMWLIPFDFVPALKDV